MSAFCNYEFEDVAWDEFCQSVDHAAPDPGSQRLNDHFVPGDNLKKRHCEITSTLNNTRDGSAARCVNQGREQYLTLMSKRRNTMLENDTCLHAPNDDSVKEESTSASDNTMSSSHGLKSNNTDSNGSGICENDAILGDTSVTADNAAFCCPLPNIANTGSNRDFFENDENKDSADFLHYGWPEIGNFEDIDGMLRGCDSAFGLGASKEDDLGWFSSPDDIGDELKSDFKFPIPESNMVENISENHNSFKEYSIDASAITSEQIRYEDTSSATENSDMYLSFASGPPIADNKDRFIPKEQVVDFNSKIQTGVPTNCLLRTGCASMMNEHEKQFKLKSLSDGKSEEHYFRNGSFNHVSNLPNKVMQLRSGHTSNQTLASVHSDQQQHAPVPDSNFYLQKPISYLHSDDSHLSDPSLANSTIHTVKSEPSEPSFQVTALSGYEKGEKLCNLRGIQSSVNSILKNGSATVQGSTCGPGLVQKLENHSGSEGVSLLNRSELGSSNVQERTSSDLDDISLEAAGFCQLQLVMEQLDLKTKLCIRDSLYRLARSAELRHNHENLNGGCGHERVACGSIMAEGTNKCTSFMDIETDTNPIDRSVAHLLFHKSSDSSASPGPWACTKSTSNG